MTILVYRMRNKMKSPCVKASASARGLSLCTQIPKRSFSIPAKHFGTRLTTTFIRNSLLYHLNRQRYPNSVSIIISITARTYSGHSSPSSMPIQNVSMLSPTAFGAPRIQKLIIMNHLRVINISRIRRETRRRPALFMLYTMRGDDKALQFRRCAI